MMLCADQTAGINERRRPMLDVACAYSSETHHPTNKTPQIGDKGFVLIQNATMAIAEDLSRSAFGKTV